MAYCRMMIDKLMMMARLGESSLYCFWVYDLTGASFCGTYRKDHSTKIPSGTSNITTECVVV